ncbi:MAG: hypothetical protein KBS52_00545 [Clostridiales bacterium]|nr:hypothetical protein [Candidatus Equinaster intestinalis]
MKKLISVMACISLSFLMIFAGCKEAVRNINDILSDITAAEQSDSSDIVSEIGQKEDERTENRKAEETDSKAEKQQENTPSEAEPEGKQGKYKNYCYSFLSDAQKGYYKLMMRAIDNLLTGKILVNGAAEDPNAQNNISLAFTSLLADHPEYFWLKTSFKTFLESNSEEIYIQFTYLVEDRGKLEDMKDELNRAVAALLKKSEGLSAFEKEVYFHDYLCDSIDYSQSTNFCHTVYGALVEGKSVCEGYSKAMQLLLNFSDINCITVRGEDNDGYSHMWNKLELAGEWYALDVTWDDPINTDKISYAFFNLTDKQMGETHVTDKNYTPDTLPKRFVNLEYNFCLPDANGKYYTAEKAE